MRVEALRLAYAGPEHEREARESERVRENAMKAAREAARVAAKINRMSDLYRDRLIGIRRGK